MNLNAPVSLGGTVTVRYDQQTESLLLQDLADDGRTPPISIGPDEFSNLCDYVDQVGDELSDAGILCSCGERLNDDLSCPVCTPETN